MEYAVIGLGRFGVAVATELQSQGNEVIAIDVDQSRSREIAEEVEHALILDGTDEKALKEAAIDHIDTVIVGMGSLNQSLLTCLALQNIGVKKIIAKATSKSHADILKKIGVDKIVRPEADMGRRLALKLDNNMVLDYIDISDEIRMDSVEVNDVCKALINKTINEINLRKKYGINIICIKRGKELIIPESNTMVLKDDVLIVVGESHKVDKFEKNGLKK